MEKKAKAFERKKKDTEGPESPDEKKFGFWGTKKRVLESTKTKGVVCGARAG